MSVIRVVSYNIHKGRRALSRRGSLYDLRLGLYGLRPDLLFLQEVQGRNDRARFLHAQHESLAAGLRLHVAYGCNAVRRNTDHGNALLSRFDIVAFDNQDVSDHRLEQRGMLHARVAVAGREVHCIVVHLGLFGASRTRQIQALIDRIDQHVPPDAPLLIAGDFNDWKDQLAPLFLTRLGVAEVFAHAPTGMGFRHKSSPRPRQSRQRLRIGLREGLRRSMQRLREALHGHGPKQVRVNQLGMAGSESRLPPPRTFPAALPWLRLDRIYQRGFAVRSARVLRGKPWTRFSDHAPILAELELP